MCNSASSAGGFVYFETNCKGLRGEDRFYKRNGERVELRDVPEASEIQVFVIFVEELDLGYRLCTTFNISSCMRSIFTERPIFRRLLVR